VLKPPSHVGNQASHRGREATLAMLGSQAPCLRLLATEHTKSNNPIRYQPDATMRIHNLTGSPIRGSIQFHAGQLPVDGEHSQSWIFRGIVSTKRRACSKNAETADCSWKWLQNLLLPKHRV